MSTASDPAADPGGSHPKVVVVVPCYNEACRLDEPAYLELAASGRIHLLFVDDGSTDDTCSVLERLARASARIDVLTLPRNQGKAEAVRLGLRWAIDSGAGIVGYLDADLATPVSELLHLVDTLEACSDRVAVFGSRVARLGSHIERSPFRHYTGRVFATFASWALDAAVYDTQCGAKVFRVNPTLIDALRTPFRSAWSFDVLLCQRLLDGTADHPGLPLASFYEFPLERWVDVSGSKVTVVGSLLALWDVVVMGVGRRTRRGRSHRSANPGEGRPT
jgi:dolichyl-phosphate beta-glucosyltransferase